MEELFAGTSLILLLICGTIPYFIPSIVAVVRKHPNRVPIIVLNIFLGWTFIGWIAALVWSLTNPSPPVVVQQINHNPDQGLTPEQKKKVE